MIAEQLIDQVLEGISVADALEGVSMPVSRSMVASILASLKQDPKVLPMVKGFVRNPDNQAAFNAVRTYLSKFYGLQFASPTAAADFLGAMVN